MSVRRSTNRHDKEGTISSSSAVTSWLQKPSGVIGWLKFGLAIAGAVAGAGLMAATLHPVMSRSDKISSVADWGSAAVAAAAASLSNWSANRASEVRGYKGQSRDETPTATDTVTVMQTSAETTAPQLPENDWQSTATHVPATTETTVVREAIDRGDSLAMLGDYAAARLLYQFAAQRGSADAALKLAKTYETDFLTKSIGLRPDTAEAARWYEAAEKLHPGIQTQPR